MKTNLQSIRKRAGFRSAKAFAEHMGIPVPTYTDYEQGRRAFDLTRAIEFADALGCSLDELAGRDWPATPLDSFTDPRQRAVNRAFESMNDMGREIAARTVMALSKGAAYMAAPAKSGEGSDLAEVM